jgi:hypothetical protein
MSVDYIRVYRHTLLISEHDLDLDIQRDDRFKEYP